MSRNLSKIFAVLFFASLLFAWSIPTYAGGCGENGTGLACDTHGAGADSLTRLANLPFRNNPFGLLKGMGSVFEKLAKPIRGAYGSWVQSIVPGKPTGVAEQVLFNIGSEGAVQGVIGLVPAGIGKAGALARQRFPGLGIPSEVRNALKALRPGAEAYNEALRAWRHFQIEGRSWATYKGEMVDVYRVQTQATPEILAQSAREGGLPLSTRMIDELAQARGSVNPETYARVYEAWHNEVYGQSPFLSTAREVEFAKTYQPVRTVVEETAGHLWHLKVADPAAMIKMRVPTALTHSEIPWHQLRQFRLPSTEVPLFHGATPGMVLGAETLPGYTEVQNLISSQGGYLIRQGVWRGP